MRYKIGITSNLRKRAATFRTALPHFQVVTYYQSSQASQIEKMLHSRLDAFRIRNSEWFRLPEHYQFDLDWFFTLAEQPNTIAQGERNDLFD